MDGTGKPNKYGRTQWSCLASVVEYDQAAYHRNCKIREWLLEPIPSLRGEELRVYVAHLLSWASRRMSMAYEIDNLIEERLVEAGLDAQIHSVA